MVSGPGYESWLEQRDDGWYVCEIGGGWGQQYEYGPYRWKWRARITLWSVAP